ncbi:MAG TPA: peptidoglycan-binding domain-containing protein [Burkholderiaceae bacterium]|nr:peptidoglycan-binding domain-containing protein [Burkholderiaceae bacterium]
MQHDEQTIRQAQRQLQQMGHYDGQIDGIKGPRTEAALRQYQQQRNLPQTGRLDSQTMQSLGVQAGTGTQPAAGMQQRGQIGAGTQPAAGTAASGVETTVDHDGTRVVPGGGDVDPGPRTVTGSGAQR